MRITKEQISEMKKLSKSGKKYSEIAKQMNISPVVVAYHLDGKYKIKLIERARKYRDKMSDEEKKRIYESQKEYRKQYFKDRYHSDEEFREKHKARCRKNIYIPIELKGGKK